MSSAIGSAESAIVAWTFAGPTSIHATFSSGATSQSLERSSVWGPTSGCAGREATASVEVSGAGPDDPHTVVLRSPALEAEAPSSSFGRWAVAIALLLAGGAVVLAVLVLKDVL